MLNRSMRDFVTVAGLIAVALSMGCDDGGDSAPAPTSPVSSTVMDVMRWRADLEAGHTIRAEDFDEAKTDWGTFKEQELLGKGFGDQPWIVGTPLVRDVFKGDFVRVRDVVVPRRPGDPVDFPLWLDRKRVDVGSLKVGDRVDVYGRVGGWGPPDTPDTVQERLIVRNVRVVRIGLVDDKTPASAPADPEFAKFMRMLDPGRMVIVELRSETAEQMERLGLQLRDDIRVVVRRADEPAGENDGLLNPDLMKFLPPKRQ
jgi:hypothetical protein